MAENENILTPLDEELEESPYYKFLGWVEFINPDAVTDGAILGDEY